jgi:hypothetical protein
MLIKDTETTQEHIKQMKFQEDNLKLAQYLEDQLTPGLPFDDQGKLRLNKEAQMGTPLSTEVFEKKLASIAPSVVFKPHWKPSKRTLRYGPSEEHFIVYENSQAMPEFSVFSPRTRRLQTSETTKPGFRLSRADLPKYEYIPPEYDTLGNMTREPDIIWDGPLPGEQDITEGWNEDLRGWRTVLVQLVLNGVISISDMEKTFGSANRRSYALYLGKRDSTQAH